MEQEERSGAKTGGSGLLIVGIAVGALALLGCCGVVGAGAFWIFSHRTTAPDIVGRWEFDEIAKLILEFRPDGTGTIEVPEAKLRLPMKFKLDNDTLTITPAQPQNFGFGERDAFDRLERTRVQRTGNELRMEAIAGPGQGQMMVLKKIG